MITETAAVTPWTYSAFRRGFVAALPFLASNGLAGLIMGVAYRGIGFNFTTAVSFSFFVYSSTAQAVTLGLWAVPPPIVAMVLASIAMNARYLVMGAHLRQLFADVPKRLMLPILALLADASWMMTVAEADRGRRDAGYLLGSSLPMAIGWVGGTALGYALPLQPQGPLALAAAFLPMAFVAALLPTQWRGRRSLPSWVVAVATGMLAARLIGPSWAMLCGGTAGTLVSLIRGDDAAGEKPRGEKSGREESVGEKPEKDDA